MKGDQVVRMIPYKDGGANHGHSCVKGRFAWGYASHPDRVLKPLIRDKSVILLFLHGGASQTETFDPKMSAPAEIRSATGELATTLPGVTDTRWAKSRSSLIINKMISP